MPDKVPQAEGVKLCDPMYAQAIAGWITSISLSVSSSVSESSVSFLLPREEGTSLYVAMIICAVCQARRIKDRVAKLHYLRMHEYRPSVTLGIIEMISREVLGSPLFPSTEYRTPSLESVDLLAHIER